jgi:hypothetical protein
VPRFAQHDKEEIMRISLGLAAAVGALPILVVSACSTPSPAAPLRGTVIDKEYDKPVYIKNPATSDTKEQCSVKRGKTVCVHVPDTKQPPSILADPGCYELTIRTGDQVREVCDEAAYKALDVEDTYDATKDYRRREK